MAKQYFFDFDGTLAAPVFNGGTGMSIGFPEQDFTAFCSTYGPNAYDDCRPVKEVIDFAKKMKEEGNRCVVITAADASGDTFGEQWAKLAWLRRMGLFRKDCRIAQFLENMEKAGTTYTTKTSTETFLNDLAVAGMFLDEAETIPYWK